jgi:vitamin K-dependent gamma-carboxylase
MVVGRIARALDRPVDAASVAVFRISFGALLFVAVLRFILQGHVRGYYEEPRFFFHYWGFSWLEPLPAPFMYVLYGLLALAALCICLGFQYRAAATAFTLGFSYAHLCDKTNYLNHYYLVSLLTALLAFLPLDREFSVRVVRDPGQRCGQVRAWALYLLRFQVGVVYLFGGIGKLGADWLWYAEPLRIWLTSRAELPVLGHLLVQPGAALAFSWCGALFDLSIVPLLSWHLTRGPAYLVLIVFHVLTALLFPIGMFPWFMIVSATVLLPSSWPRRWLGRWGVAQMGEGVAGAALTGKARLAATAYAAVQLLLPLRSHLYPGNTLWSEEGFRFSWKVMLIEKVGSLEFQVVDAAGRTYAVSPNQYLTPLQARMAATQPDMILELARFIARDFEARGHGAVRVYADAQVTFNGRLRRALLDPRRDLSHERDGLAPKSWILPAPTAAPVF